MPSARRWEVEGRFGSKLTCRHLIAMSALPPKADMCSASWYVRFVPKADIAGAQKNLQPPRRNEPAGF